MLDRSEQVSNLSEAALNLWTALREQNWNYWTNGTSKSSVATASSGASRFQKSCMTKLGQSFSSFLQNESKATFKCGTQSTFYSEISGLFQILRFFNFYNNGNDVLITKKFWNTDQMDTSSFIFVG